MTNLMQAELEAVCSAFRPTIRHANFCSSQIVWTDKTNLDDCKPSSDCESQILCSLLIGDQERGALVHCDEIWGGYMFLRKLLFLFYKWSVMKLRSSPLLKGGLHFHKDFLQKIKLTIKLDLNLNIFASLKS